MNSQIQSEPGTGEKAFVLFVLLLSLGAFQNLMVTRAAQSPNLAMPKMQGLWSFLYLVTLLLYSRRCESPIRGLFTVSPLMAVIVFTFASVLWSQDPALTARRSIALALTVVFGVYFALRFKPKEQFRLLAWAFLICIIFSFIFELFGLNYQMGSGWYGIFFIKVHLGRNMALGALIFLFWEKVESKHSAVARVGLVASIVLVALSRDVTSWIVLTVMLILLPYLQWTLRRSIRWALGGIGFLLALGTFSVMYVWTHLDTFTAFLGKDPLLTGRVPLWILSTVMAMRRPWLGYGFDAFWLPDEGAVQRIWHILRWEPPHAHNGILELWLEIGLIGTALFLIVFVYYVTRALRMLRSSSEATAAWPLMFLLFLFLANLTESVFLGTNSICSILYVAAATTLSLKQSEARVGGRFAVPQASYA